MLCSDKSGCRKGAECTEPWVEPKPSHLFGRCGIDEVSQDEMAAGKFAQHYSLQRPFIVRNTSFNDAARQFLADRCKIMRQYGDVSVDVGAPILAPSWFAPHDVTLALAQVTRSRSRYMGGRAHRQPSASIWTRRLTPRRRGTSSIEWVTGKAVGCCAGGLLTDHTHSSLG